MIYKNVIQDTNGNSSGISKITLKLLLTNWGEVAEVEIFFIYSDTPRKTEGQSSDHYTTVCSQFTPFLQSIEGNVVSQEYRELIFGPGEEELNDSAIGLNK